mmetsp:Transcript_43922/g.136708  ORF Transcript_43922/g.136708 Transcript_43922/m.136708 type:complete len:429 (-) Transcript_43922:157-1443(-)
MVPADMLATQVMLPAEMLATQVMAPTLDLLATQVMVPVDRDLLATQVMRPVDAEAAGSEAKAPAPTEAEQQVEYEKPTEQKQVKRPKTAFWLFQDEMRSKVAEELGTSAGGATKIVAELAARWKALDGVAKAKYTEKAQELMAGYRKDIAEGAVPATSAKKRRAASATAKKASAAAKKKAARQRRLKNLKRRAGPKKPQGSYSLWLCDHSKDVRTRLVAEGHADPGFEDVARAAAKAWLALTPEQKAPYVERAQALAAKFKEINAACKEYKRASVKDAKAKARKKTQKGKARPVGKAKTDDSKAKKEAAPKVGGPARGRGRPRKVAAEAEEGEAAGAGTRAEETPRKRAAVAAGSTPSKAKKAQAEPTAYLDMALVAEAEKAGMAGTFRRLAEREDMKPFAQRKLLDALVASEGLLHRAKEVVLASTA